MSQRSGVLGYVLQGVVALGLSTVPFWLQSFFDDNSKYQYLFQPPYIYQYIAVALALVFSPQLVILAWTIWRQMTSLLFYAVYRFRRGGWPAGLLAGLALLMLVVGSINFAYGAARYGYSVLRELKYHEDIYLGHLTIAINESEKVGGRTAALDQIDRVVALYPEYDEGPMARWAERVRHAMDVSEMLRVKGDTFRERGQIQSAIGFYGAAFDVWPENAAARSSLAGYLALFDKAKPALVSLYDSCIAQNGDPTSTPDQGWDFVTRAPLTLKQLAHSGVERARVQVSAELCDLPRTQPTAEAFVATLSRDLFADRQVSVLKLGR